MKKKEFLETLSKIRQLAVDCFNTDPSIDDTGGYLLEIINIVDECEKEQEGGRGE